MRRLVKGGSKNILDQKQTKKQKKKKSKVQKKASSQGEMDFSHYSFDLQGF